jgi:N-terminal domain of galactosyltransferase
MTTKQSTIETTDNKHQYYFTYIIGYRHSPDRLNNLKRVLDWINGFSGADVILVEQDKHSKVSHLNLKCRHIFVKSNMPYNRSWSFNIGIKNSKSNIIVFGDSDLIMEPSDFVSGIKELEKYEMVSPYSSVLDLTPNESNFPLEQIMLIQRPGRGETDNQKINICGGISMFRKDSIKKIAGWDERFLSWGGEDDYQTIKVKNFLSSIELNKKCYHLYHTKSQPDNKCYQTNLQILQHANSLSKEDLVRMINMSSQKIGMHNLYDNY